MMFVFLFVSEYGHWDGVRCGLHRIGWYTQGIWV
jgi:hypothetical protein